MLGTGCIFFFNRKLLAMGNVTLLLGLMVTVGFKRTVVFFTRRDRWRSALTTCVGVGLVLYRYTVVGMSVELLGLLSLIAYVSSSFNCQLNQKLEIFTLY